MVTWLEFSREMHLATVRLGHEWDCLPAEGSIDSVSVEIDAACDKWCMRLAKDLDAKIRPPKRLRPWIMKRLSYASVFAKCCHKNGAKPFPEDHFPDAAYVLLIDIWHQGKFGVN